MLLINHEGKLESAIRSDIQYNSRSGKNIGHLEIPEVIQATARLTVMVVTKLVTFANQACVYFLVSLVSTGLRSFHHSL